MTAPSKSTAPARRPAKEGEPCARRCNGGTGGDNPGRTNETAHPAPPAQSPAPAEPILPTEFEVDGQGGIVVGQRVQLRREALAELRTAGMSERGIERRSVAARVKRIVVSKAKGWVSAELDFESGVWSWCMVEDLEPCP